MKSTYFLFFLFIQMIMAQSIYSQESHGDSLSVDQVVRMVLKNNPTVQKGVHQLEASRAILGQSRSKLYPNISGVASYSRIGPLEQLTIPDFGTFSLFPANNYDAHLGLQQLIYDFGRRHQSINLSETETRSAEDRLDKIKSDLAYQTIYAFYTILFLQEDIKVLDEQIFDLNQHLDVTEKKVKAGTAINYDVLTTQVRVAAAKSQRENVINLLEKQKIILRQFMSVPEDIPLDLIGKIEIKNVELKSDSLVSLAERQRYDFKLSQDAQMAAAIRHSIASRGHFPLISMNLLYGFKNGYIPDLNVMQANWVAAIRLDIPVFEGFRIRYKKNQTHAELRAAGAGMEETRNMIRSQVKQAISDIQTSLIQVKTTRVQLEQAIEAKSMAETQYNIGVISNLELLDSQTLLTQARFNHLKSKYGWTLNYYTLEQAIGTKQW